MMKIFLLSFCIVCCLSNINYQERAIYLNETDNVCYPGNSDAINVTIVINGSTSIKVVTSGLTGCSGWRRQYWSKIEPSDVFGIDFGDGNHITCLEETRYIWGLESVKKIIQKTTIENPAKINGTLHECQISGTEKIEHFGRFDMVVLCNVKNSNLQSE